MKIENHYDWIVIGEHPAALLSGCLAARLGLRVLSVPFFRRSSGFLSKSGQYIDLESNRMLTLAASNSGSDESAFLKKIILELCEVDNLSTAEFLTDRKITIETPDFKKELNSSSPKFSRGFIRSWIENLNVTENSDQKKQAASPLVSVNDFVPEHELVNRALFALFSNEKYTNDFHTLANLKEVSSNWGAIRGGRMAYQRLLRLKGARWGVQFADDHECRRIFAKEGRISGVQLAGRGEVVAARGAALGVPLDMVRENVHGQIEKSPSAKYWKMTLALTFNEVAFPPGLSDVYLWQEPESSAIEVEWAYPKDYGVRQEGVRYVFLRTQLPYDSVSLQPEYQRKVAARMYKKFLELFPFADKHLIKMFPDFRNSIDEFTEGFGYAAIEMIPEFLKVYDSHGVSVRSGIEGLFVTNSEAYPELGDFGGTRSAVEAVTWIAQQSGLKGALL